MTAALSNTDAPHHIRATPQPQDDDLSADRQEYQLGVATINVGGLAATGTTRTGALLDQCEEWQADVVCVQETKAKAKQMAFVVAADRRQDWATFHSCNTGRHRAGGVATFLRKNLVNHIQAIKRVDGHGIALRLCFRRQAVWIINIYAPPGDRRAEVEPSLLDLIRYVQQTAAAFNDMIVLAGDFNAAASPFQDRPTRNADPDVPSEHSLHPAVDDMGMVDAWLYAVRNVQESRDDLDNERLTWRGLSRLDYIYMTECLAERMTSCVTRIVQPPDTTGHRAVIAHFDLQHILDAECAAAINRELRAASRRVLAVKQLTQNCWDQYQRQLEVLPLTPALQQLLDEVYSHVDERKCPDCTESGRTIHQDEGLESLCDACIVACNPHDLLIQDPDAIYTIWRDFSAAVMTAAKASLPWRTVEDPGLKPVHKGPVRSAIVSIISLCRRLRKHRVLPAAAWRRCLAVVGDDLVDAELLDHDPAVSHTLTQLYRVRTALWSTIGRDERATRQERINVAIEQRCAAADTNVKKMLDSLLSRHRQQSAIDRVVIRHGNHTSLATHPDEVRRGMMQAIAQWYDVSDEQETNALPVELLPDYEPLSHEGVWCGTTPTSIIQSGRSTPATY
ncbi:hypothetical protein RI367_002903 [Sorochytrium milnesiophthora]